MTIRMKIILCLCIVYLPQVLIGQSDEKKIWVDSIFNEMTDSERIGQLFMIRAHSDKGEEHVDKLIKLVEEQQVGGLCFFQGNPEEQARINNLLNERVKHVPLLVSGRRGLGP